MEDLQYQINLMINYCIRVEYLSNFFTMYHMYFFVVLILEQYFCDRYYVNIDYNNT